MIQGIALTILLIKNSYMSYTTQVKMAQNAVAIIEHDTGVRYHISRIYKTTEQYPELQGFANRVTRMNKYETFMMKHRLWNNRGVNLIMDTALLQGGIRWIAGFANICKPFGGFAIVQTQDVNDLGLSRTLQSLIAIIHELTHPLGANDLPNGKGYMNAGASGLNPLPTKYDAVSLKEINKCLGD